MSNRWEPKTSSRSGSRSWRGIASVVIFVAGLTALGVAGLLVTGVEKVKCGVICELNKPDVFVAFEPAQPHRITMIPESGKEIEVLSMMLTNDGSVPMTIRTPRVDFLETSAGKLVTAEATIALLPNAIALFRIEATQLDPVQPINATVTIRIHTRAAALVGGAQNISVFLGNATGWRELKTAYVGQVGDSDQWQWLEFETDEFAYFSVAQKL